MNAVLTEGLLVRIQRGTGGLRVGPGIREDAMAPSHEMVPMRLGFADVLGARTLGALPGLERDGLPLTE